MCILKCWLLLYFTKIFYVKCYLLLNKCCPFALKAKLRCTFLDALHNNYAKYIKQTN